MRKYKDEKNKEEFKAKKSKVLNKLEDYIDDEIERDYKRSYLITSWLDEYRQFLKQELTFQPQYRPVYKQGAVVLVNLGFNIGSEEGGMHYCIVLNKKDTKDNPILTVVPLSSVKKNKKRYPTDVDLDTEIYDLVFTKAKTTRNRVKETLDILQETLEDIDSSNADGINIESIEKNIKSAENDIDLTERCIQKIQNLKSGSYAICNQITTVSKVRVKDPIKPNSVMHDIIVSDAILNDIYNKITKYYMN